VAAWEQKAFLALGHEEDPDWALHLERVRGLEPELQQARAEQASWEFALAVQDVRAAEEEQAAPGSPQWLPEVKPSWSDQRQFSRPALWRRCAPPRAEPHRRAPGRKE
jgi:hypothetical protein